MGAAWGQRPREEKLREGGNPEAKEGQREGEARGEACQAGSLGKSWQAGVSALTRE